MSNPIASSSSLNHKEETIAIPASITIPEDSVSSYSGGADTKVIQQESPEALFRRLQFLETSCYGMILSTFRAQGELTWQKHKVLEDLRVLLHISPQRHRAEMLRAESDPLLQKIATHCNEKEHVRPPYEEEEVTTAEQTRLAEMALYSYSDTESEAEDVHHRFAAPRLRGARGQYAADAAGAQKKRGRKRREREEGAVEKPKKRKVGRPPKEKVDEATAAAVDTILAQTDYREIATLSYEDVEEVAEKEQQQIEELDKLLNQTDDLVQKQRIMAEVQRKKDKLIELIEHLEAL